MYLDKQLLECQPEDYSQAARSKGIIVTAPCFLQATTCQFYSLLPVQIRQMS